VTAAAVVVLAYVCGSIPFGLLLARRAGVDVRRSGSGNIGASNVARTAGGRLGALTLLADAAKGAVPVAVARALVPGDAAPAAAAVAAVAGHVFPVTLRFAGGKGVATALGALAVLVPAATGCAVLVFGVVFAACRWVSLASIVAACATPLLAAATGASRAAIAAAGATAVVVLLRHRQNARRLLAGTEPRFTLHKKEAVPSK